MTEYENMIVVGSEEWLGLPVLNIPVVKARIDSGAKTSSLHAFNIRSFNRGGVRWVSFEIHPLQHNRRTLVRCEAEVVDRRTVKSSSGTTEKRYVIRTFVHVLSQNWEIELTLTNRDSMGYRMLLGREAMLNRILVDPSARFLCGNLGRAEIENSYSLPSNAAGLRIGLLASNPDLYSNQRILEAGEQRGHQIQFYDIKQCYMKLDADNPEILYRGGRVINELDAIIPRIKPSMTFYGTALIRQFESIGVYSLNSAKSISNSRDKLFSLQMLLKNGLEIPTSGFANSPLDTHDLIDMVDGAPLIIKLLQGRRGRGVVLAETKKAAESVINAFKSLSANLLVQEFVNEAEGRDLRLFVVGGKVVAAVQRKAAAGDFRPDLTHGGSSTKAKITAEESKIAIKAARVLGLKVAGVDIIRSEKGPLLLEVKSSPTLESIEAATGKDIAGNMITAIENKLGWKPALADQ